jgi:hypothetical protein
MKKTLLLTFLWFTAGSVYLLAGQGDIAYKGGSPAVHEARFNVFDYATKKPVLNAGVFDKGGNELGITDKKGVLVLNLPAIASDVYVVKSEGYTDINIRLTHAEKKSADYDVFLQPSSGKILTTASDNASEETKDQDLVKVYVKQDPHAYQKSKEDSNVEFAVQLSASSKPLADKKSLQSWEDLGPVYVHSENGLYKVRIGPFVTQEDAKAVLQKAKSRGTKDAFIVVQQGLENHKPYEFQHTSESAVAAQTTPTKTVVGSEPETNSEIATTHVEYKVRLASYLHPGGFNPKDIDQFGPLESYRQGEWTIMLIGGFKTEADASKVKDQVIAKGYVDAKVVMDQDGILVETK